MTMTSQTYSEDFVRVAGGQVHLLKGGVGAPLVIMHHDIGSPGWLPFYEELAKRFSVYVPSYPGYGRSERPDWMRSVRDLAICQQWLLQELKLEGVSLVGLGYGGWVAAEMAIMAPRQFKRLILVGAMGLQPKNGEILDQAIFNHEDYVRRGFHDLSRFEAVFTSEPATDQLVEWDINREMTFRIAWKPYMYSQTMPHLIGGVETPTLVVWGRQDGIVPLECGEQYAGALPNARLEVLDNCGHFVEMEKPEELATLVAAFVPTV